MTLFFCAGFAPYAGFDDITSMPLTDRTGSASLAAVLAAGNEKPSEPCLCQIDGGNRMTRLSASPAREHPKWIDNAGTSAKADKMTAIDFKPQLFQDKKRGRVDRREVEGHVNKDTTQTGQRPGLRKSLLSNLSDGRQQQLEIL